MVPPLHFATRMRSAVSSLLLALALCLPAAPAAAQSGPRNCATTSQNLIVRDVLDQYYLWYQELPRVNPANYESPEAYLEAVRYRPLDNTFSYITSRAANDAFYGDSQFVGFGISTQTDGAEMRVLQVFPDSPASEAGLARGDRILEINGRSVARPDRVGRDRRRLRRQRARRHRRSIVFRSRAGDERRATLTKRVVTIPTVSLTRTFHVDGRTVGYLFFRNFVEPSYEALDEAFAALREAGATELVLDLRYNGGGLVDVAVHLAGLIGGPLHRQAACSRVPAQRQEHAPQRRRCAFDEPPQPLSLLAAVRDHDAIVGVGERAGDQRPAAAHARRRHRRYRPTASRSVSTASRSATRCWRRCVLAGQRRRPGRLLRRHRARLRGGRRRRARSRRRREEASLAEAFRYIRTGQCSPTTLAPESRTMRARASPERAYGWHSLINAY